MPLSSARISMGSSTRFAVRTRRGSMTKRWIARFRAMLGMFDVIRVDHFRGFVAVWEVPFEDETAENGRWVDVPGYDLFRSLTHALGPLPVIAEDLGNITPDVDALRSEFDFP